MEKGVTFLVHNIYMQHILSVCKSLDGPVSITANYIPVTVFLFERFHLMLVSSIISHIRQRLTVD